VKWLFASAGANIDAKDTVILNMRTSSAEEVLKGVLDPKQELAR
jgi:hypothetical protein